MEVYVTIVSIREISKRYKGMLLFESVSFEMTEGRTYGLVGSNGSGKSVLLKIICGFERPDSGEVEIDSRYLSARRTFPDKFGITINGPAYLPGLSARNNLLELSRIRRRIGVEQINQVMSSLGLDPESRTHVRSFSQGMKHKLALAQALMEEPEVLVLDEPFNALDVESVFAVKALLRDQQQRGTTIIFTSHHAEDIDDLSDEVLQISDRSVNPVRADSAR
jgi:ABC-2 type transport system ATP-binding protein